MQIFDLAIAYVWEYDSELIELIEQNFQEDGLSTFIIGKFNLSEVIDNLKKKKLYFNAYLDRASGFPSDFETAYP